MVGLVPQGLDRRLTMAANLPIEVLRSFVAIVDSGSMLKASDRVFLSQSAISLQVKRLEDLLQQSLFSREGRKLALTPAGEAFLGYARRLLALNDEAVSAISGATVQGPLRVGMVQDFAETLFTGLFADFSALNPEASIFARVGGTYELKEALAADQLDLVLGFADAATPQPLRIDPMIWIGSAELAERDVLPLAVLERPCRFREAALAALDAAHRRYRIVIETPNLATLRAGVNAGLGLSCRTRLLPGVTELTPRPTLPTLPAVATVLLTRTDVSKGARRLEGLIRSTILPLEAEPTAP